MLQDPKEEQKEEQQQQLLPWLPVSFLWKHRLLLLLLLFNLTMFAEVEVSEQLRTT